MNIVAVILLGVMVYLVIFIDKHEIVSNETLLVVDDLQDINTNIVIMDINVNKMQETNFNSLDENKYYLIKNSSKTSDLYISDYDAIIRSYIKYGKRICTFDAKYVYNDNNNTFFIKTLKKYIVLAMNYVQFFVKKDIKYAEVIFIKGEDLKNISKLLKKDIVFFGPSDIIIENKKSVKDITRDIINSKYGLANFFVAALSITIGAVVTSNLIYNIFAFIFNFSVFTLRELVFAILIYYCYMAINNVIYKPIGKLKIISSVFFYIFGLVYLIASLKNIRGG